METPDPPNVPRFRASKQVATWHPGWHPFRILRVYFSCGSQRNFHHHPSPRCEEFLQLGWPRLKKLKLGFLHCMVKPGSGRGYRCWKTSLVGGWKPHPKPDAKEKWQVWRVYLYSLEFPNDPKDVFIINPGGHWHPGVKLLFWIKNDQKCLENHQKVSVSSHFTSGDSGRYFCWQIYPSWSGVFYRIILDLQTNHSSPWFPVFKLYLVKRDIGNFRSKHHESNMLIYYFLILSTGNMEFLDDSILCIYQGKFGIRLWINKANKNPTTENFGEFPMPFFVLSPLRKPRVTPPWWHRITFIGH